MTTSKDILCTPGPASFFGYDPDTWRYDIFDGTPNVIEVSGTKISETLQTGALLPDWITRESVQEVLRRETPAGHALFVE